MFEGPHDTNVFVDSSFQWWSPPISLDRGGWVRRSRCILLGWRGFKNVSLIHHECCQLLEVFCVYCEFLIILQLVLISLLLVGFNGGFDGEELFIIIGIHLVTPFWNFEV